MGGCCACSIPSRPTEKMYTLPSRPIARKKKHVLNRPPCLENMSQSHKKVYTSHNTYRPVQSRRVKKCPIVRTYLLKNFTPTVLPDSSSYVFLIFEFSPVPPFLPAKQVRTVSSRACAENCHSDTWQPAAFIVIELERRCRIAPIVYTARPRSVKNSRPTVAPPLQLCIPRLPVQPTSIVLTRQKHVKTVASRTFADNCHSYTW